MKKQFCIYLMLENFTNYSNGELLEYDAKFGRLYDYEFQDWMHHFLIITDSISIPRNICKELNKYKEMCYSYKSWTEWL